MPVFEGRTWMKINFHNRLKCEDLFGLYPLFIFVVQRYKLLNAKGFLEPKNSL